MLTSAFDVVFGERTKAVAGILNEYEMFAEPYPVSFASHSFHLYPDFRVADISTACS